MPRTCNLIQKLHRSPSTNYKQSSFTALLPLWGKHKSVDLDCHHKAAECHKCDEVGHLARVCKVKDKPPTRKEPCSKQHSTAVCPTHVLSAETDDYSMYTLTGSSVKPLVVSVKLNDVDLEMELDTGASISIISEATYNHLWSKEQAPVIQESQIKQKLTVGNSCLSRKW